MAVVAFAPGNRSEQSGTFLQYARAALEALHEQSGNMPSSNELLPHFLRRDGIDPALSGQVNLSLSNNSEFMGQLVQAGENADYVLVFAGICLLPVIYVIFTARAKAMLYPTANQLVSVEGLLHADLAFSLTLDMLDIVAMFRDSFGRYNSVSWLGTETAIKWICFAVVVLTIAGVVCLGFAFPMRSADTREAVASSLSRTDMFISAKYAFLVGLFMVDVPYLALRIYWIVERDTIAFFMFKNVYCLLTRPLRLNQCRLAEREKAKGTQKSFYDQDAFPAEYRRGEATDGDDENDQQWGASSVDGYQHDRKRYHLEEEEEEEEKEEENENEDTDTDGGKRDFDIVYRSRPTSTEDDTSEGEGIGRRRRGHRRQHLQHQQRRREEEEGDRTTATAYRSNPGTFERGGEGALSRARILLPTTSTSTTAFTTTPYNDPDDGDNEYDPTPTYTDESVRGGRSKGSRRSRRRRREGGGGSRRRGRRRERRGEGGALVSRRVSAGNTDTDNSSPYYRSQWSGGGAGYSASPYKGKYDVIHDEEEKEEDSGGGNSNIRSRGPLRFAGGYDALHAAAPIDSEDNCELSDSAAFSSTSWWKQTNCVAAAAPPPPPRPRPRAPLSFMRQEVHASALAASSTDGDCDVSSDSDYTISEYTAFTRRRRRSTRPASRNFWQLQQQLFSSLATDSGEGDVGDVFSPLSSPSSPLSAPQRHPTHKDSMSRGHSTNHRYHHYHHHHPHHHQELQLQYQRQQQKPEPDCDDQQLERQLQQQQQQQQQEEEEEEYKMESFHEAEHQQQEQPIRKHQLQLQKLLQQANSKANSVKYRTLSSCSRVNLRSSTAVHEDRDASMMAKGGGSHASSSFPSSFSFRWLAPPPHSRSRSLFDAARRWLTLTAFADGELHGPCGAAATGSNSFTSCTSRREDNSQQDMSRHYEGTHAGYYYISGVVSKNYTGPPQQQQHEREHGTGAFVRSASSPRSSYGSSTEQVQQEEPLFFQRFNPVTLSASPPPPPRRDMVVVHANDAHDHSSPTATSMQQAPRRSAERFRSSLLLQSRPPPVINPAPRDPGASPSTVTLLSSPAGPAAARASPDAGASHQTLVGRRVVENEEEEGEGATGRLPVGAQQQQKHQQSPQKVEQQRSPPRHGRSMRWRRFSSLWGLRPPPPSGAGTELLQVQNEEDVTSRGMGEDGDGGGATVSAGAPWSQLHSGNPPLSLAAATQRGGGGGGIREEGKQTAAGGGGYEGQFFRDGRLLAAGQGAPQEGMTYFPSSNAALVGMSPSHVEAPISTGPQPCVGHAGVAATTTTGGVVGGIWAREEVPSPALGHVVGGGATTERATAVESGRFPALAPAQVPEGTAFGKIAGGGGLRKHFTGAFNTLHKKLSDEQAAPTDAAGVRAPAPLSTREENTGTLSTGGATGYLPPSLTGAAATGPTAAAAAAGGERPSGALAGTTLTGGGGGGDILGAVGGGADGGNTGTGGDSSPRSSTTGGGHKGEGGPESTAVHRSVVGAHHQPQQQQQQRQGGASTTEKTKPQTRQKKHLSCRERLKQRRERNLLRDLNYVRSLPVKSVGFWACTWRFIVGFFYGGREGLRTMLDDLFVLPYLKQLRLLLSPIFYHGTMLGLFVLLLFCTPYAVNGLPGIAAWPEFFPVTNWQESDKVDRTAVVVVCALTLLQLLFYLLSAPILDVVFVSVGASLRLLSSYLMLRAFAISFAQQLIPSAQILAGLPAPMQQQYQHPNETRFLGLIVTVVFMALPACRLLALTLPACFALCGKRYVSFKREKTRAAYEPLSCEEDPSLWTQARGLYGNRRLYTVSNAILFYACRHCVAPISFNVLLCGPDVFKDIRLLDNLAHAQLCDLVVLVLLQFYALTMQLSWYMLGVFLGHDAFLIIYLVIGQTVRIMAQRRYEVKLLLQELVLQRNDGFRLPDDDDEDEESEYGGFEREKKRTTKSVRFFTLADVEEEYQTEGYFSSPGCIFPQFL